MGAGATAERSTRTVRCACSRDGSWRVWTADTDRASRSAPAAAHSSTVMSIMGAEAFHSTPDSTALLREGLASHCARVGAPGPSGSDAGPDGGASRPGMRAATIPDRHSAPAIERGSTSARPNTHPLPAGSPEQAARTAAANAAAEAASSRAGPAGASQGGRPPGEADSTICRSYVWRTSKPRFGPPRSQRSCASRSPPDIGPSDRTENDGEAATCRPTLSHAYTRTYGIVPHS